MKGVSSMRLGLSDGGRGLRMGDILSPRPALTQAHHAGRRWGQHGRKPQGPARSDQHQAVVSYSCLANLTYFFLVAPKAPITWPFSKWPVNFPAALVG